MQSLQEKQIEVWEESIVIIEKIKNINSEGALVSMLPELEELLQKAAFLKISFNLASESDVAPITMSFSDANLQDLEDQLDLDDQSIPEPVLEKMDNDYFEAGNETLEQPADPDLLSENNKEESIEVLAQPIEELPSEETEASEPENKTQEDEVTNPVELSEDLASPVSESINQVSEDQITAENIEKEEHNHDSKPQKIKLAHIKGLHVESLFGEEEKNVPVAEQAEMPEKYNEKQKQDFKLDLNDKMAFSKMLFNGSQVELNETIRQLNSYNTLDGAKQYLSEVYYERNWKKADEYAQRLWSLVEHKFL